MRNLVLLFLRFGHFILFVLLELFCLYLIVNYNRKQRDIWGNSSNIFMGHVSEKWNDWTTKSEVEYTNLPTGNYTFHVRGKNINGVITEEVIYQFRIVPPWYASILAKTYRDDFMFAAHEKHPEYAWNKNKGYPTKAHRAAIKEIGPTDIHRMSFRLLPEQLELDI